jgi:hypothetical protein
MLNHLDKQAMYFGPIQVRSARQRAEISRALRRRREARVA